MEYTAFSAISNEKVEMENCGKYCNKNIIEEDNTPLFGIIYLVQQ